MLRVDTDHPHDSFALDDLAFVTNLFYTGPDFHGLCLNPCLIPLAPNLKQEKLGETSSNPKPSQRMATRRLPEHDYARGEGELYQPRPAGA